MSGLAISIGRRPCLLAGAGIAAGPARTEWAPPRQIRLVVSDRGYFIFLAMLPFIMGVLALTVPGDVGFGKPVPAVRRQLRHLGLDVQVRWQPSNRMPPGRVLSVKPTGLLPREGTVVLVGTLTPRSAGLGAPTSPGHHGRSGTSRHHGRQSHPGGQPPPTGTSHAWGTPVISVRKAIRRPSGE